jgi:hypothetical protein
MYIKLHQCAKGIIAEVLCDGILIKTTQDALDLMADVDSRDSKKIILYKENISPDFFNLITGLAGEILQKFVNYRIKLAVVGDFSKLSKNFNAFIVECNRGSQFFFAASLEEAIKKYDSN